MTTYSRGYDGQHTALRRRWAGIVRSGQATCVRCGGPILEGEKWHLDHSDDREGYLGVSHAFCNLRAAGRKAQKILRARRARVQDEVWSRAWL